MSNRLYGCALNEEEFAQTAEEYRRAAEHYSANARLDGGSALIELRGDKAPIASLLSGMTTREAGCCPHLQFAVEETPDGYQVILSTRGITGIERLVLTDAVSVLFPTATLTGKAAGERVRVDVTAISRDEIRARLDRNEPLTIIEALPEMYYRKAHLPSTLNIPVEQLADRAPALLSDKDAPIIVYCMNLSCKNSSLAAVWLIEHGYTDVYESPEGKQDWIEAGLPTERGRP